MSNQRYTPGFKDEALRQVVERGYSVAEVTVLIGSVFFYRHDYSWSSRIDLLLPSQIILQLREIAPRAVRCRAANMCVLKSRCVDQEAGQALVCRG